MTITFFGGGPPETLSFHGLLIQNRPQTYGSALPRADGATSFAQSGNLVGLITSVAGTSTYYTSAANGPALDYGTSATATNAATVSTGSPQAALQYKPSTVLEWSVDSVASGRFFAGFSASTAVIDGDDQHAVVGNYIGLTYSLARGDTNFQWVKATPSAQTLVDTGVPLGTGPYFLTVDASNGTDVVLTLYDTSFTVLATHTFLAPCTPTTALRDVIGLEATTAADRRLRVYQMHKVMQP